MSGLFPALYILEMQLYGAEFALIFLAWWTDEIGFSVLWYFLSVLEYLIQAFQWLFLVVGVTEHVDIWGTPFVMPSYVLTMGTTVLVYGLYYYWWWWRRPSMTATLYMVFLAVSLVYIATVLEYVWWQWLFSLVLGLLYGLGTALWMRYDFVPTWMPLLLQRIEPKDGFPWTYLFGTRNTLFPQEEQRRQGWKATTSQNA